MLIKWSHSKVFRVAQKAETNEGRSATREQNKKRGREHVRVHLENAHALKVHCSLYAVCEPLHLAEWWAGEQLRNNERGAALDCFKKAIEVTPAMAARLIQVLKAEVTTLVQQHQQHSSCCRVLNTLWRLMRATHNVPTCAPQERWLSAPVVYQL